MLKKNLKSLSSFNFLNKSYKKRLILKFEILLFVKIKKKFNQIQ